MPYREPPEPAVAILRLLGEELHRARSVRGFSQAALARHAGVSQSTVSLFERGLAPGLRVSRYALMIATLSRSREPALRRRDRFDELREAHPEPREVYPEPREVHPEPREVYPEPREPTRPERIDGPDDDLRQSMTAIDQSR